jgi:long-subunit fatty acid transport protein
MKENSTEIDAYFTELTGGYQLLDNFWLIGGFRFIRRRNDASPSTDDENHIRLHADARYGHSIKRLNLNARLRYQTRDELGVSNAEGDFANHYVRLKLGAVYDFRSWKLDPQISTEVFHHSQKNEEYGFNKFRVSLGTEYSFNNWGKLGLFYRYEHEINAEEPRTTDIIRIQYVYTLKGY